MDYKKQYYLTIPNLHMFYLKNPTLLILLINKASHYYAVLFVTGLLCMRKVLYIILLEHTRENIHCMSKMSNKCLGVCLKMQLK